MLRNDLYRPWFTSKEDWGIEILDGEFKDVVLQIRSLEFVENGDGNVQLEYDIIHKPETLEDADIKGEMFTGVMNTIINDILKEAVEYAEQDRNNNPEESNSR